MVEPENKGIPEDGVPETKEESAIVNINELPDRKLGETLPKPQLGGEIVEITDITLTAGDIKVTKDGQKKIKSFPLRLTYKLSNGDLAYENYGGFGKFINPDGTESSLTLNWQGTNKGAILFNTWLKFVGKKAEDVSLKTFLMELKGLKAKLVEVQVNNPMKGEMTHKNIVDIFVKGE